MAPIQSKPTSPTTSGRHEQIIKATFRAFPPSIPFEPALSRPSGSLTSAKDEKDPKCRAFNVPLDRNNKQDGDSFKAYIWCFEDGTPEDWCRINEEVEDLVKAMGVDQDTDAQHNIWRSLLLGKAKDRFTALYNKVAVENRAMVTTEQQAASKLLQLTLNGVARKIFKDWEYAIRNQKRYMVHGLAMGHKDPEAFIDRVQKMNRFIKYFPSPDPSTKPSGLDERDMMDLIIMAAPAEWHISMLSQGKRTDRFTSIEEVTEYLVQLHRADKLRKTLGLEKKSRPAPNSDGPPNKRHKKERTFPKSSKEKAVCPHCKKYGTHKPEEFTQNPANRNKGSTFKKTAPMKESSHAITPSTKNEPEDDDLDVDDFIRQLHVNTGIESDLE